MKKFVRTAAICLAGAASLLALPASAHHSFSMFDQTKNVTIQGTVKAFTWSNPHVWLDVTVTEKGGTLRNWGMEAPSVGILHRQGWKADSFKAGQQVTVVLHPMKDGTIGGQLLTAKGPDGKEFVGGGRASELKN